MMISMEFSCVIEKWDVMGCPQGDLHEMVIEESVAGNGPRDFQ